MSLFQCTIFSNIWINFCGFHFAGGLSRELPWGALDDVVMGGVSESTFQVDPTGGENGGPTGVFKGLFLLNFSISVYVLLFEE